MKRKYTVILEKDPSGGYHAFCPVLAGCHSQGETVEDALVHIKEAIEVYLESLAAHGESEPESPLLLIAEAEVESHAQAVAS